MSTALMFSGQGAQKVGMGKDLFANSSIARSFFDEADSLFGWSLSKICFEGPEEALTETKVCQPALFVHGFAIFSILRENGMLDDASVAMGLSLGEVTACAAAGVFDFKTGLEIVEKRATLMQEACEASDGSMAAVIGEDRDTVAKFCEELGVEMANLNCPGQIVISGESDRIAKSVEEGKARGFKRVMPIKVAGAYHSRLMEPAKKGFASFLSDIDFKEPTLTLFTNTTGRTVSDPDRIRDALVEQIVSPVLWEDCMVNAAASGVTQFCELGVGSVLRGHVKRTNRDWDHCGCGTWEEVQALEAVCN